MSEKTAYKTKQRGILLDYLKTVPGEHITAGDVCAYFHDQGSPIGQSTVYRQLERLVDEGIVSKYVIDGSSAACFEYTGERAQTEKETCYHCKCEKCGRLVHLHCDEVAQLSEHLYEHHRFRLNPMRTVFYGLCEDCLNEAGA